MKWQSKVRRRLRAADAVIPIGWIRDTAADCRRTFSLLSSFGRSRGDPSAHDPCVDEFIQDLLDEGAIDPVDGQLVLNQVLDPPALPCEAAQQLVPGAMVSLAFVLGAAGVINNRPHVVTSVVPGQPAEPAWSVETAAGTFRFHAADRAVLEAGEREDRLSPERYPRATPEAALVHTLHLEAFGHAVMVPSDIDLEALDPDRLARLARSSGLEAEVGEAIARAERYWADPDNAASGSARFGI